jgi:hypothetical protein
LLQTATPWSIAVGSPSTSLASSSVIPSRSPSASEGRSDGNAAPFSPPIEFLPAVVDKVSVDAYSANGG